MISSAEIAKERHIPPKFIGQIVADLSRAGLVITSRGMKGGIRLARQASDINLKEIIETIDGPIRVNCCVIKNGECPIEEECPIRLVWVEAHQKMADAMSAITIKQIASLRNEKD